MWINPEHIISLIPKIVFDGTHHTLRVEVKLAGTPDFDAWLGRLGTVEGADARWTEFLDDIRGG